MLARQPAVDAPEDVVQRALADLPQGARRERPVLALALDEAGLLQHARELLDLFGHLARLFTHQPPNLSAVELARIVGTHRFNELLLELVEALHVTHEAHGLLQREGIVALEW